MPTEVTNEAKQALSRIAETSRTQQQRTVIEAEGTNARQSLPENEQVLPSTKESSQPSSEQLEQAADELNQHVQSLQRDLHFSVDEDTGETIIKVVDSQSQRTIRTIPSDEFLSLSQQLNQSVGILLNAEV